MDIFYFANLSMVLYWASSFSFFIRNFYSSSWSKFSTTPLLYYNFIDIFPYYFRSYSNIYRGFSFYFISFCSEIASSFSAWDFVPLLILTFSTVTDVYFLLFFVNSFTIINLIIPSNYSISSLILKFIYVFKVLEITPVFRTSILPFSISIKGWRSFDTLSLTF